MKILLVGGGGREHALALKLKASSTAVELHAAPGSDAMAELGNCLPLGVENTAGIEVWCRDQKPDLVVIGPELPLVLGLADRLGALGIPVFGHDQATARLEGSKAFSKAFMQRHGIPCAASSTVTDLAEGRAQIEVWPHGFPIVLKADGLAAGKGVVLADSKAEALQTLEHFLAGQFGEASKTVLLEAPLRGMELSLHVLVDVTPAHAAWAVMPPCQDHKRIFEGDRGPNTGGMGAFGPIPFLRPEDLVLLEERLVKPTVEGLRADGLVGRGVLFLGVMWTAEGPQLLEYNCRFGDPETQVLMELLDEELPELLLEVATHRLRTRSLRMKAGTAITVVLAAEDYPEGARKGVPIALDAPRCRVIHAGTKLGPEGWLTNGGRVINLVTVQADLEAARQAVSADLDRVDWPGRQVRRDIGLRALTHAQAGRGVLDPW